MPRVSRFGQGSALRPDRVTLLLHGKAPALAQPAGPGLKYIVVLPRHPLVPFLLVSLGLHLSLLFAWPDRGGDQPAVEKIPVSLVPPTEESKPEPSASAQEERGRPVKAPAGQV